MKLPLINTDPCLQQDVEAACEVLARAGKVHGVGGGMTFEPMVLSSGEAAIDHINYQMPPLLLLNFCDPAVDAFAVMEQIVADPWLNNGGIVAFFRDPPVQERIHQLRDTNIVIVLHAAEVRQQLPRVLEVIRENQQILFQRAFQRDFFSELSGSFRLDNDLTIISAYANLVANYLYNMGFIESDRKTGVGLCLTELLINAVEHGNCAISGAEKREHLGRGEIMHSLVARKCSDPAIAGRRVDFAYHILPEYSEYVIRDEGRGFDWRRHLEADPVDLLAEHGRGIWLARSVVDQVRYNDRGNEVRLRIEHRRHTASAVPRAFSGNEIVTFAPDDVVFQQGEESSFLYYIAEGEYRVMVGDRVIDTVNAADILVGEMSFLLEEKRSATVIANTPGRLIKIPKESFIRSIKEQPYYGLFLSKLLAERLRRLAHRGSE